MSAGGIAGSERGKDFGAIFALAAVTVAGFWPLLLGKRVLCFGDLTLYFEPLLAFQRGELLRGRIPLWNPGILCGTPFVGNPQAWPLYPSSLLLYGVSAARVTGAIGVLHLFLAALGTYFFLRLRGHGWSATLFAAIAWGFGGAIVSKMQFPNMVQSAAFLPWLLWGLERLRLRANAGRTAALALIVGLAVLAAHPQMTLMQAYLAIAWAAWRAVGLDRHERIRFLGWAAAAAALGGLLAAAQLLPVAELTRSSVRAGLTLTRANRFILPGYVSLCNFLLPNFFGNPATPTDYVARGNFWEPCAYAGVLAFALSVGAAARLSRRVPEVRFWAVVALVGVWLSLGRDAGLYAIAFRVLPGVAKFHDPARFLHVATFALACLSAHGFDAVTALPRVYMRRALAIALLVLNTVDLFAFTRTLNLLGPPDLFSTSPAADGSRPRAYFADERLLWGRFVSYRTFDTERGLDAERFAHSDGPNIGTTTGFTLVNGYEPVQGAETAQRLVAIDRATGSARDTLLRHAGASLVITLDSRTTTPCIRPLTGKTGRAWAGNEALPVMDISPDEIAIERADTSGEATITLADTAYPGWVADASGQRLPLGATAEGWREIPVSGQQRVIRLRYLPTSWRIGLFMTLLASGILMAIAGNVLAQSVARGRADTPKKAARREDGGPID